MTADTAGGVSRYAMELIETLGAFEIEVVPPTMGAFARSGINDCQYTRMAGSNKE